jgi:hypothetical protein
MHKLVILNDDDYARIGRNIGSDLLHRESEEGLARWERDLAVLALYGFTSEEMDRFRGWFTLHADLINQRSETIARKKSTLAERDRHLHAAWTWVEQCAAILGRLSAGDEELVHRFNEVYPEDDADLWRALDPLAALLEARKDAFPASVPVRALLDEVPALRERTAELFGRAEVAKAAPVQDTREIDILDGRLYVTLRELNSAGRRAIRAGRLTRTPPFYRFNHLRQAPRPTPVPAEG